MHTGLPDSRDPREGAGGPESVRRLKHCSGCVGTGGPPNLARLRVLGPPGQKCWSTPELRPDSPRPGLRLPSWYGHRAAGFGGCMRKELFRTNGERGYDNKVAYGKLWSTLASAAHQCT